MILNISRAIYFQSCRTKYKERFVKLNEPLRTPDPLTIGGAAHKGIAHVFATKDVAGGVTLTEKFYREELVGQMILPEELPRIEQNIELSKRIVQKYGEYYCKDADFQVIHPEVTFLVPMPDTFHHCWFFHKLLYPNLPFEKCSLARDYSCATAHACWQPHYFTGRTDAIIQWNKLLWLLEHKTNGLTGEPFNKWLMSWDLELQPTGYIYGIWKSIGLRPHGFILNVIQKPRKNAADPFNVQFQREPFLKSDEQLEEFEREFIQIANDLEDATIHDHFYRNTKSCFDYMRICDYYHVCKRMHENIPGEFLPGGSDYVTEAYKTIIEKQKGGTSA